MLLLAVMCIFSHTKYLSFFHTNSTVLRNQLSVQQFNSDTNYPELAQTQVNAAVPQNCPCFRGQLQMGAPATHTSLLAINLGIFPPQVQ